MATLEFNTLERAVLEAICTSQPGLAVLLTSMFQTADVTKRNNTGTGFYTYFTVDRSLPALISPHGRMIDGPQEFRVKVRDGDLAVMGFILWLDGGYPDCLEGYQFYREIEGTVTAWTDLEHEDLNALDPIG